MAKPKSHKGQHFVPRTYLAAWCDPDTPEHMEPYVWRFGRTGQSAVKKSPHNIFKETDFYTIPMPDGSRNLNLEHGLGELEGRFADIRARLENHSELSAIEIVSLLAFMVAMSFRTKAYRDFQQSQFMKVFELADSVAKQFADGRPGPPNGASEPTGVSVNVGDIKEVAERPIQTLLPIQMNATLPVFASMSIAIVETAEVPGFITSDDPCIWFDPDAYRRPPMYRSPSLMDSDVEVTLPISPRQMAMLNRKGVAGYCTAPHRVIEECNRRVVTYADEYVIVSRDMKDEAWFEEREPPEDAWEKVRSRRKE